MPVPEQIPHINYTTDGRTTDFPLTFDCPDQSHLIVSLDDIEPAVGQWSLIDNTVVFLTAPASNQTLSIERNTPLERTRTYKTNDNSFRPTALNKDFDYIWRKLQELGYKDSVLLRMIIKEIADRKTGDRLLDAKIAAEEVERIGADSFLQSQITSNDKQIDDLYRKLAKEILYRIDGDREAKRYAKDYVDFMMTKESEDMPIFSGVADNIVITENGDTQRDVNRKTVTTVDSIADLSSIQKWSGRTVYVKNDAFYSYNGTTLDWEIQSSKDLGASRSVKTIYELKTYQPYDQSQYVTVQRYSAEADPRSGGEFYYDASDTTSIEDGVFIFTSTVLNGRWKRVLDNNKINILQGGLVGTGDESDLLNNLLTACANQSTVLNLSRKFELDGLQMRIKTTKTITLNMTLVNAHSFDIVATLPDQDNYNITGGTALVIVGSDAWTNNPVTYRRRHKEEIKGIEVIDNGSGKNTLGIYLQPDIEGQFANAIFEQLNVQGFDYCLVLNSNTYLTAFNSCAFDGPKQFHVTTSSYIGITSSMKNMGENIRFNDSTFANSAIGVLIADYEMWIKLNDCSLDYNGKKENLTAWFELLANIGLTLNDCHMEAGNENSQLGKRLFHATTELSSVDINGGTMLLGNADNCDNEYVFYSENPLNQNFNVDGPWVVSGGLAKKAWSNTGMGRFRIKPNTGVAMQDVAAPAVQAPNKSLTLDYNFAKANLLQKPVDQWWVSDGGDTTRTSSISSSGVTGSYTSTADENGVLVSCLKLVVNKTEQQVKLLIKRPKLRNAFNPAFRLRYKSNIEVPGNLFASVKPVDVSQEIDVSKSIFVPTVNESRWDKSVFGFNVEYTANTDVKEMRYQLCNTRSFVGLETYDYYLFTFDFTLRAGFELYILSAECYDMDN